MLKKWTRWQLVLSGILLLLVMILAIGEYVGWPFLAKPLEKILTQKLNRQVNFSRDDFQVRFIGGIRLHTAQLEIAAPKWSQSTYLMTAKKLNLDLDYIDLWRAYRNKPLHIQRLQANYLDANLERLLDGRRSWQFSDNTASIKEPIDLPSFGRLAVTKGHLHYVDAPLFTDVNAVFSLDNATSDSLQKGSTLHLDAHGLYKKLPLKITLLSTADLPTSTGAKQKMPIAQIEFNAIIGHTTLAFKGSATDAFHLSDFKGNYDLKGPSLSAVGDFFGLTLPTTSAFNMHGLISKINEDWHVNVDALHIGASRLNGEFNYNHRLTVPLLTGKLGGAKLLLTDLGPALGAEPTANKRKKVLPTRPFDLVSMRKMDADVSVNIQYVDLHTRILAPLRPLRANLRLKEGVLTLTNLDARTAEGRLMGDLSLDGRSSKALWDANLRWSGVQLEQWLKLKRADKSPPYITGKLNGKAVLKGQGRSTAEILASLNGSFLSEIQQGTLSHLVVEAAGLDLAQVLGVMFKGDDVLPLQCAVVSLEANAGIFRPKVMVFDTSDSTIWMDGSISLAREELNLRTVVMPKDFSPLTFRSPVYVTGTFANPHVSLDKKPVGLKLAGSILLGLINPLAAVIPLFDTGDKAEANKRKAGCQQLMQHQPAKPALH